MNARTLLPPLLAAALAGAAAAAEPPVVAYVGTEQVTNAADGGLRPVVGVHNIQVVRANRTRPLHTEQLGHTYLHAPMLAWWRGKFYLEYLSGPRDEHQPPCATSLTSSADGVNWTAPRTVFPAFKLADGTETVNHQRMGFYMAPDGRLLVLAFYGKAPSPNDGTGLGRAVREIHEDGTFGPISIIRYNTQAGWSEKDTPFPFYQKSPDAGFVAACNALLADKLMTAQWWEEDRATDGFYTVMGKALSFYHRKDGAVVGLWKDALSALTIDGGQTWTTKQQSTNMPVNASKYWGQRTSDGRYALVLNPTNRHRHPLAVMLSDDGATFDQLYTIHGELPDQRFPGAYKNLGPQYVRGIAEGNGTPPDRALWLTYSVNKEDIWISRVPVPITAPVTETVSAGFDSTAVGELPVDWNVYSPLWAPVRVVDAGDKQARALEVRDEDPYDYARAVRVFPETHGLKLSFKVLARQTTARLEIELLSAQGARPIRLALGEDGHLWGNHEGIWQDAGPYAAGQWLTLTVEIPANPKSDRAAVRRDGKEAFSRALVFAEPAATVERLSFRTGAFRDHGQAGKELPGADAKAPAAVFLVDDVSLVPEK